MIRKLLRLGATAGLYLLGIVGASSWDRDPDSWFLIIMRLSAAVLFLGGAVYRTVGHWHEIERD